MRPVNLIPSDERGADRPPLRTGVLSYVLIGALALALLGMIGLVFTNKQVSDKKSEVAQLQQEQAQAEARAQSLQAFTNFRTVQESRAATVSSLATSRFDWRRVLEELARVIPPDVWLVQMSGTVSPAVQLDDGTASSGRASVPGPALEVVGCATGQDAVAGLVADLEEIDGVTRVGLESSSRSDNGSGGTSDSAGGDSNECRTRDFITKFELVVAFDKVPNPSTATSVPTLPPGAAPVTGSSPQLASSTGGG